MDVRTRLGTVGWSEEPDLTNLRVAYGSRNSARVHGREKSRVLVEGIESEMGFQVGRVCELR